MNHGKKLLLLPFFLILLVLSFAAVRSFAQTPVNYDVTISPILFDLSANPGDTVSNKIRFRNNTSTPLPIKLGVEKITADLNGNIALKADKNDTTLSWISFQNPTFVAQPLEWTDIPFTITIPKDAAYGYYWTITFAQDKTSPLSRSGVSLTGAAGLPILLDVQKAGAKIQGNLKSFVSDSGFYEYPPVKFSVNFVNTGNVHIRPKGSIFIKDWLGRQLTVLDVNAEQGAVLPNSERSFQSVWDDGFITVEPKLQYGQPQLDKNGKPETQLKINWGKILDLRIGRYTATTLLVLSTPQRDIPYQAQTSFWIFPWKVVLIVLAVVIFAGLGFYNTLKNLLLRVAGIFGFAKRGTQSED
jgi:hypothetical protein